MLQIHTGHEMEAELGERFVECFVAAADDAGLPADTEFRTCLRNYMEWAVAEVMAYTPKGSTVAPGLAIPHWSWDGLVE